MIKILFIFGFILNCGFVNAQTVDSSEGRSETKEEHLTVADLRERLVINADIFVTDPNGKLLFQENQSGTWRFGKEGNIHSNFMFKSPNISEIALKNIWSINTDGRLWVEIKQYDSMKKTPHTSQVTDGKLLKSSKIEIKNFNPVVWETESNNKQKVMVRFVPSLKTKNVGAVEASDLPISLQDPVIYDNQGRLWSESKSIQGKYISIKTHLGLLALSYFPFKNAREIGFVEKSQMKLKVNPKLEITIQTSEVINSAAKPLKIYGLVDFNKKTESRTRLEASASSTEKDFKY